MNKLIIKSLSELRKPCEPLQSLDELTPILLELKTALATTTGYALAANQIGILKQVAYGVIPETGQEILLINPKIITKEAPIKFAESCLSFPGVVVYTKRYNQITIENNGSQETYEGITAVVVQHEIDHLNGKVLFDRKWKSR